MNVEIYLGKPKEERKKNWIRHFKYFHYENRTIHSPTLLTKKLYYLGLLYSVILFPSFTNVARNVFQIFLATILFRQNVLWTPVALLKSFLRCLSPYTLRFLPGPLKSHPSKFLGTSLMFISFIRLTRFYHSFIGSISVRNIVYILLATYSVPSLFPKQKKQLHS